MFFIVIVIVLGQDDNLEKINLVNMVLPCPHKFFLESYGS